LAFVAAFSSISLPRSQRLGKRNECWTSNQKRFDAIDSHNGAVETPPQPKDRILSATVGRLILVGASLWGGFPVWLVIRAIH
jgi:hypothetical protein